MKISDLPEKYSSGRERIPYSMMKQIVESNEDSRQSCGTSKSEFEKVRRWFSSRYPNFQVYEYLDNRDFINYENLKLGELVAVKFNGVNYVTYDIKKLLRNKKVQNFWKASVNAHPKHNFFLRYALTEWTNH